jgi:CBS domain containing-hemolysin-like protein
VVDEFGSVEGLVTLSDVMETIAGNLPNEVDEIDARHDIQKNPDGSWTANGHMPLEDLVQYVPLPLDENANTTPSRVADGVFATYSATREEVQVGDYLIKTLQVESHRVQKVQLIPPA